MRIGIFGFGTVGKGVYDLLKRDVVKVFCLESDGKLFTNRYQDVIDEKVNVIFECLPDIEIAYLAIKEALKAHINVISSNKAIITKHYKELMNLAKENGVYLRYEAAVAGGIPWIHSIVNSKHKDEIISFSGIFNGTTNYILSSMQDSNLEFDEALNKAKSLGYAESNPTSDISGLDSKYKVILSLNTAFNTILNIDDCLNFGIELINKEIMDFAKDNNLSIKLIGYGDRENAFVMPMFIKNEHILASIKENYNATSLKTKNLDSLTLIGQGAGRYPTADAMLKDLCVPYELSNDFISLDIKNNKQFKFYLSAKVIDDKYLEKEVKGGYITKEMSIKDIASLVNKECFIGGFYD